MADKKKDFPKTIGELLWHINIPVGPMSDADLLSLAKGEWDKFSSSGDLPEPTSLQTSRRATYKADLPKAEPRSRHTAPRRVPRRVLQGKG